MCESCALADNWLAAAVHGGGQQPLPNDLLRHIATCPRCRLALVALIADQIGPLPAPDDQLCAAIADQIPAFVDYERAAGLAAAARAFPDVWWHTLVCPDCDELYRTLIGLAALPDALPAANLPQPIMPPLVSRVEMSVHPGVLAKIASMRRLGQGLGAQSEDMIIAEREADLGLVQITVQQEDSFELAIVVRTNPPVNGVVILTLGEASYRQPLDAQGQTVFHGFSEAQLSAGQNLTLKISPPED